MLDHLLDDSFRSASVRHCRQRQLISHRCGQNHPLGQLASELHRLKVRDTDNLAPRQLLRLVELGDARHDLPLFISQIQLQLEQLVGL